MDRYPEDSQNALDFVRVGRGDASGGIAGLILLALLLCGVFFLSVGAYGMFAEGDGGSQEGYLSDAVLALRQLAEDNEAVAVFLGFSQAGEPGSTPDDAEQQRQQAILAAAEEYIRRHQA